MANYLEEIIKQGLLAKKYRILNSALITIILAIEYSLIEALKPLGIDVYEENRKNEKYYHTLSELIDKALKKNLISQKMYDRLKAINILRRSCVHSKSGRAIEGDVNTAFEGFKQLLEELHDFKGPQPTLIQELHSKIHIIENNVITQKNVSFMGLTSHTNEIGRSYTIDSMLSFALSTCDKDILLVLAMITKYGSNNAEYLKKLLKPFNLKEERINEILRILAISGAIYIGHSHDVKVTDPNLAPIDIGRDLLEELQKFFRANWPILFEGYKDIEEDFDKPRNI